MVLNQGRACGSGDTRKLAEYGDTYPLHAGSRSTLRTQSKRNGRLMFLAASLL